jgi:hypothetical protein
MFRKSASSAIQTTDTIVACTIAAGADYLVTRDKDIRFVTPEALLKILRERKDGTDAPGDTGNH